MSANTDQGSRSPKQRLDVAIVERGLSPSRERARAAVLAGDVRVDGETVHRPGHPVREDSSIEVTAGPQYVSRGGRKLAGAMSAFHLDVEGCRAVDVGASTGGFTDFLLQAGAAGVVAIDVGYGQLAWKLREDPRVRVLERTNIRDVEAGDIGGPFDVVVCDVSFISLRVVGPHLAGLLGAGGDLIVLVKPQFEIGKGRVGKRGVVRDRGAHEEVLDAAQATLRALDLVIRGVTFSPITGPEGNIEFWLWAAHGGPETSTSVHDVVEAAHAALGG